MSFPVLYFCGLAVCVSAPDDFPTFFIHNLIKFGLLQVKFGNFLLGSSCTRMWGQRGALHADSLEVPAGLQVVYIVFEWAVELETFSGALNPQRAGWHCCRYREREREKTDDLSDYIYVFLAVWSIIFFTRGARRINILYQHTLQLIKMAFSCIILIPTKHSCCKKTSHWHISQRLFCKEKASKCE